MSNWGGPGSVTPARPYAPLPGGGVPTPVMPGGWGPHVPPNGPAGPAGLNGILGQPTPDPEHDPLIGEHVWGCTIHQKIGAGGMGAIYLAHHEALRKDVVVKILPPESAANPRTVERFFREARAAAKLDHPNIVQVQHVGTTERGLHYIIMQFVDGKNLEEKIQAEGRQRPPDALRIVMQVAQGLRAAHAAGVIHRDIKAENVLLTSAGVVKLTDFGLAKDLNSELKLTADGAMIGTPLYMAPEIGRVKEIDGRVDVYSLGVTFYYLLTGIQPFRGFSALEILSAKAHDKLKPPEEIIPDLPDEYRRVLGKMLEKDRDLRYSSVEHLIRDLEALDRNLPIEAEQPTIWPARPTGAAAAQVRASTVKLNPEQGQQLLEQVASHMQGDASAPPGRRGLSGGVLALLIGLVLLCAALGGLFFYLL
jgi:serine/threonine-protein kinase